MKGCEPRCPGCSHRALTAEESLGRKQAWLGRSLEPWQSALETIRGPGLSRREGYRAKACLHAEWRADHWAFGMLIGPRKERELVAIPECPVHTFRTRECLKILSRALPPPERLPLAYVAVSGALLTLVIKAKAAEAPDLNAYEGRFRELGIEGVFLNFHPSTGNRVFSSRGWKLIWGRNHAFFANGLGYGPASFQQLIDELYRDALAEAANFLQPRPATPVLDLYSGIGASLLLWQAAGAPSLGVELSGEAVDWSLRNTARPDASLRGRVSERLPQLEAWLSGRSPVVFANPPRTGLEPEVCSWLAEVARPHRLAYLSCNSRTQARDLLLLEKAGYAVRRIIPYDFFPQTHHVETLACLELDAADSLSGGAAARVLPGTD